jgi:aldehyde:ferredoxin oxidoreductase
MKMTAQSRSIKQGYCYKLARVNLTLGKVLVEELPPEILEQWVGGVGLGAYFLAKEVAPECLPFAEENKVFLFTGPLSGTRFPGSGTFCGVTKSPMTGFSGASQANGYFGAFLKTSGFDGLIIEGASAEPVYLVVAEGRVEIRSAAAYWGKGTFETESTILGDHDLKSSRASVFSIGPAGENQVRFATFMGDKGHALGHCGIGAVLGAKKLKAILALKEGAQVLPAQAERFEEAVGVVRGKARGYMQGRLASHGTAGLVLPAYNNGELPIRNLQTNVQEGVEKIDGTYFREHFEFRPKTCHMCPIAHNAWVKIKDGPYAGLEAEEPEYENISCLGSNLGIMNAEALIYLSYLADDLGVNTTEAGWVLSWLMECSEQKLLGPYQEEVEITWGDVAAVEKMLKAMAYRKGSIGELLAEGVMRASRSVGGGAAAAAVCTEKGNSPRGHDHRARWTELVDTCVSSTGTIEATFGRRFPAAMGEPMQDFFDADAVAKTNARVNGWRQFEDAMGTCRFCTGDAPVETMAALSALTGHELDIPAAALIGRRIVTLFRAYNCKAGLSAEMDRPSLRYGSTPMDGPAKGKAIMPQWEELRRTYYRHMGWDPETGIPTKEMLREMGLEELV